MALIPTLDLDEWDAADVDRRAEIAADLDAALRQTGIFLLRGHGVPPVLTDGMRAEGRKIFALPAEQRAKIAVARPYDNGLRGLGALQVGAVEGVVNPPDLHEAFHTGPNHRTGDTAFDTRYYPANKWSEELPGFQQTNEAYTGHMARISLRIMEVLAVVLGLPEDHFTRQSQRATWTQNVNWYPSLEAIGSVQDGQLRVGPHTDFGSISLLDRQRGKGGLEVWNEQEGWFAPPFEPGTLVVNLGDLMNLWTDGRWRSLRHRVLAPPASAPKEELVSLVFFFEADPDALITPLAAPVGGAEGMKPVIAGEEILEKVGLTLSLDG